MIDNPKYKGEWAPQKIANPAYFEDLTPVKSLAKIVCHRNKPFSDFNSDAIYQGGIGIELWTMTEDILFDNIYIGHSVEDAKKFAAETYEIKKALEDAASKAKAAAADDDEEDIVFAEDPIGFVRQRVLNFIEIAKIDPVAAFKAQPETGAGIALGLITIISMVATVFGLVGSQQKPITKVRFGDLCRLEDHTDCIHRRRKRPMRPHQTTRSHLRVYLWVMRSRRLL